MYGVDNAMDPQGFLDSDFAGHNVDRKSTTCYRFRLTKGAISWRSKKKEIVRLSTREAYYVALSTAERKVIWLKRLEGDVGLAASGVVCLNGDNQTVLQMAQEADNFPCCCR